jgi:hypothetical protein
MSLAQTRHRFNKKLIAYKIGVCIYVRNAEHDQRLGYSTLSEVNRLAYTAIAYRIERGLHWWHTALNAPSEFYSLVTRSQLANIN